MPATFNKEAVISRKYIAVLALAAAGILVIGVLLKPKKAEPQPPSPSETASLQRLVRAEELRGMASYLADRATAAAAYVVWNTEHNASGIMWGPGQVVTAPGEPDAAAPLIGVASIAARPAVRIANPPSMQHWVLVVARGAGGEPLWNAALYGGEQPAACGTLHYRELAIANVSATAFAGAGVFDLDGNLIGAVGRCGHEQVAIAAADIPAVLRSGQSPAHQLRRRFGVALAPLDERERQFFGADKGLLVRTVWQQTPADDAGIRPGDVVLSLGGQEVTRADELEPLLTSNQPASLAIRRNGRNMKLTIAPLDERGAATAGYGREPDAQPTRRATVAVRSGSAAYNAGMRTGDAIVRIGARMNPIAAAIRRLLERSNGTPVFVVYQRGPRETGVLLFK